MTMDFSTWAIGHAFSLLDRGLVVDNLLDLSIVEPEEIFQYKFRWGKETKWGIGQTRYLWKMWFDFMNNSLLFIPEEGKIKQKYMVAAIQTWKGHEVNWSVIIQQRINEEIHVRKAQSPSILYLYSASYITCLCELLRRPV